MGVALGMLNLSSGFEVEHRAEGWRVVRSEGDVCAVQFLYRANGNLRIAEFGLLRRPRIHLVPMSSDASDLADLADTWTVASQHGPDRRHDQSRLDEARRWRDGRQSGQPLMDAYVDHPDTSALVMEMDSCQDNPAPLPRSLTRPIWRAGFRRIVCRDKTHDVAREASAEREHHG